MKSVGNVFSLGLLALCLASCADVDHHVYPVVISADRSNIVLGEGVTLTWSAPGGHSVLSSNFGASTVSGSTTVYPSYSTEYRIKIRLISTDIYTAKVTVNVEDPPDEEEEEEELTARTRRENAGRRTSRLTQPTRERK